MSKDIKEMFAEVAEKAVKEKKEVGENSLINRAVATNIDHYELCPFRSLNVDDCPLCTLGKLEL